MEEFGLDGSDGVRILDFVHFLSAALMQSVLPNLYLKDELVRTIGYSEM